MSKSQSNNMILTTGRYSTFSLVPHFILKAILPEHHPPPVLRRQVSGARWVERVGAASEIMQQGSSGETADRLLLPWPALTHHFNKPFPLPRLHQGYQLPPPNMTDPDSRGSLSYLQVYPTWCPPLSLHWGIPEKTSTKIRERKSTTGANFQQNTAYNGNILKIAHRSVNRRLVKSWCVSATQYSTAVQNKEVEFVLK